MASSDRILTDFIVPALKSAQDKLSIKIVAIGPPGVSLAHSGLNVRRLDNMPYAAFKAFIASIDNGIGLIPLDGSSFSSCKSPIKLFDYSLAGIPTICSNVPPYSEHITNGTNGLLVENSTGAIYSAIELLALDHTVRLKMVESAVALTKRKCSIDSAAGVWNALVANLIQDDSHLEKRRKIGVSPTQKGKNKWWLVWMAGQLISPAAYMTAFQTFKRLGFQGLIHRIRRG